MRPLVHRSTPCVLLIAGAVALPDAWAKLRRVAETPKRRSVRVARASTGVVRGECSAWSAQLWVAHVQPVERAPAASIVSRRCGHFVMRSELVRLASARLTYRNPVSIRSGQLQSAFVAPTNEPGPLCKMCGRDSERYGARRTSPRGECVRAGGISVGAVRRCSSIRIAGHGRATFARVRQAPAMDCDSHAGDGAVALITLLT